MEPAQKKHQPDPTCPVTQDQEVSSNDTLPFVEKSLTTEEKIEGIHHNVSELHKLFFEQRREKILERERSPDLKPQAVYAKFQKYYKIAQQRCFAKFPEVLIYQGKEVIKHAETLTNGKPNSVSPCGFETHIFTCQNRRPYQQDRFLATEISLKIPNQPPLKCPLFIVCDGHGTLGEKWADYVSNALPPKLTEKLKAFNLESLSIIGVKNAIRDACLDIDEERHFSLDSDIGGTTLVFALKINSFLYVGNVGDSRAMLIEDKKIHQLSIDAHGNEAVYVKGLNKRGAVVINNRVCEVSSIRAFGNHQLKTPFGVKALSAKPKTMMVDLNDFKNPVLLLSSDGPFDTLHPNHILQLMEEVTDLKDMPKAVAGAAAKLNATDNLTVMMARLYDESCTISKN